MLKKSLLSLAVTASLVGMTGCNISSTTDNIGKLPEAQADREDAIATKVHPLFNPAASVVPLGSDFFFTAAATSDGTANTGAEGKFNESAVTNAIDDLDGGISTLSPLDVQFNASIDPTTVSGNVFLVKLPNKADIQSVPLAFPEGMTIADFEVLDLATIAPLFTVQANLPSIIGAQPAEDTDFEVSVISQDGITNNTIRVSPLKPLQSETKYILVVNGSVKDTSGNGISPSPDYESIRGTNDLVSNALVPVRALLQGLEGLAGPVITAGGANLAPVADGIAYTASYTTGNPTTVLKSMAYPGYWAPSVITNDAVAQAVIIAGYAAADKDVFPTIAAYEGYLQSVTGNTGSKIVIAVVVANGALTTAGMLPAGLIAHEHPRARTVETILAAPNTALRLTPAQITAAFATPLTEDVLVGQGAIELPQYTSKFDVTDLTTFSDTWSGNMRVGAILDAALGQESLTTPPSDVNGTKNVTYRFPFAEEKRKAVAPFLAIEPQAGSTGPGGAGCTKPGAGWPVVIMQHGFTSDRTGNLINGIKVADLTCHAVIAMDLPLHGIAPTNSALALNVDYVNSVTSAATPFAAAKAAAVAAATTAGQAALDATILDELAERHEMFYGVAGSPTPVTYADDPANGVGDSGSLWIRLDSFQRTRDNSRQAVMDLLNLNASLGAIDLDGDDVADLDTSNVNYIGHSLGAIVGTTFVAVNNSSSNTNLPEVKKAVLATPGGHLTKMIENSVALKDQVLNGLSAAVGINQGDSSLESYMKVFQATVDSADPMNFIAELADGAAADTPTLVVGMYGNGTTNPADLVVPVNGNGPVLASGAAQAETANSPLVGLDPMLTLLGAENVMNTPTSDKLVTKYNEGGHGTFSSAGTGGSDAPNYDSQVAFGEMLTQTVTFLLSGAGSSANAAGVLITDAE